MRERLRAITGCFIITLLILVIASEWACPGLGYSEGITGAGPDYARGLLALREETVKSWGEEPTRVKIAGNSVLVPVTLSYGGNEVEAHLLLDTGCTVTSIRPEIAEELSINLDKAKKTRVQVVGGGVLEARLVKISSLSVGPHTKRNWNIFVVPHPKSFTRYDGLLGMDVLRGLKYQIDFNKQVIIWE